MKQLLSLALTLMLAALCGCGGAASTSGAPESESQSQSAQIPNPVVVVESAAGFEPLGLAIDAPEGATEALYSVISDQIAQIQFTYDGLDFTYRAARTTDDISGVYETFDNESMGVEIDGNNWSASVGIKTIDGGKRGALATWRNGDIQYSLYTGGDVGPEVETSPFGSLATKLAETTNSQ